MRDIAEAGREQPTVDLTDFVRPAGLPALALGTLFERAALALGVSSKPRSVREGAMRLHTRVKQWADKRGSHLGVAAFDLSAFFLVGLLL